MTAFRRGDRWASKFVLNGRQIWTPGSPWETKRQALEAERRHRDRLNARRSEETCASFAERWLEEWPRPSAATQRLYTAAAKRFAQDFGPTLLEDVRRLEARAWALGVPRSVSRVITTMFEDARNVGLVEVNHFSGLRLPATEKRPEVKPPTLEEYRALLDACPVLGGYGTEFKSMIQFAGWTGLRQGELFGLQWGDIAEDGQSAWISRSRKLDGSLGLPKNGRERRLPIRVEARVLDSVPRRPDSFVFHSPRGRPLIKGTFGWSWQKVKSAARAEVKWHSLRHFCATQLLEQGYSHFDVSIQLGHTDGGALVMSRYGHPSVDAAMRRLLDLPEPSRVDIGSLPGSRMAENG